MFKYALFPLMLLIALIGVWIAIRLQRGMRGDIRSRIWCRWAMAGFMLLSLPIVGYAAWNNGQYVPVAVMAAALVVALVVALVAAMRQPKERELRTVFAHDPTRCARCGYDLRATPGSTCSECGWDIPTDLHRIEQSDWAVWWKRWSIPYLDNWRRTLRGMIAIWLMFAALLVWFVFAVPQRSRIFDVSVSLLLAHFMINIVRVMQYGRRAV